MVLTFIKHYCFLSTKCIPVQYCKSSNIYIIIINYNNTYNIHLQNIFNVFVVFFVPIKLILL